MSLCTKCSEEERGMRNSWCRPCNRIADRDRYAKSLIVKKACRVCNVEILCKSRKSPICSVCKSAIMRDRYANNTNGFRDKAIANNIPEVRYRQGLKRKYNLTEEQLGAILFLQECKCAICRVEITASENKKGQKSTTLAVDHDHLTGEVRGVLCIKCNTALGGFRDDAALLSRAAQYVSAS